MSEEKILLAMKAALDVIRPLDLRVNEKVAALQAAIELLRVQPDNARH